jgi:hypothetical protein
MNRVASAAHGHVGRKPWHRRLAKITARTAARAIRATLSASATATVSAVVVVAAVAANALLATILACTPSLALAVEAPFRIDAARDFPADALARPASVSPLVVLFSRNGCPWCERIKQQHLRHLPADVVLREVNVESDAPLVDFAGQSTTQRRFAATHKVRLAPTLAFFGPDGRQLAEPIVGLRGPDFMDFYIDAALAESRQKLTP